LFAHYNPLSPVTEAFRNVKTNIKFGPSLKTILVTSSGPKEGKTNTITNLALVCAQEGLQTLLVSSDLRKPYLSNYFGIPEKPGLSDIVMGSCSLEEGIRRFSDMVLGGMGVDEVVSHPGLSHLALLPSGSSSVNPAEILNSPEFDKILDQMKNMFDVILFDSPPVLPVADASILSKRVDGVVLCYEVGRTSRHALLRVKQQLEGVGAHFIGIVLNHTLPGSESEVYPYYRKYAKEYAAESPKGKDKEKPL
jgi:Mrp family chromosome partitioning ATPase